MDPLLAYCGLNCATCPIHLATLEPDPGKKRAMREEIAVTCSHQFGMALLPADVTDCDGCPLPSGKMFSGCAACEIRRCAIRRNLKSCAFCDHFACDELLKIFKTDLPARARLEAMRATA